MSEAALTPSVSWAQRPKLVFVTINVSDVENPDIKVVRAMDGNHVKTLTIIVDIRWRRIPCISRGLHLRTRSCTRYFRNIFNETTFLGRVHRKKVAADTVVQMQEAKDELENPLFR